uniref:Transmembrane protein 39A n=1 Tax=Angiostrongylus cantonensis TaxID=6313 RepID=A0A158P777_ANGCA
MAPPRQRKHVNPPVQGSSLADDSSASITGVVVSVHPVWPDMQFTQGELFFECTLFLYSVLALFLQYLNIYKTLWWLPKSYWHYSMKFHLINPYFLSCVGLLLGWRVTKCFWKTITELMATIALDKSTFVQSTLTVIEYAIVKTPLMTLIITSFLFSFSRICHDFPFNSVLIERAVEPPPAQLDLDSVLHMCSCNPVQIREEVSLLLEDLYLRLKRSLFAGVSTAFLSIFLPCVFVPYKTSLGVPQKVLVDETWESELCIVVAFTAFSLYITYLMPLNYLDLLHRSAVHLGTWDQIEGPKIGQTGQANWAPSPWVAQCLYSDGETVQMPDGRCYRARGSAVLRTVAAEPGCPDHDKFFMLCGRPCTIINGMCIFEGALIVTQFWMLVLTIDWQHIVTLVLLMFANYLLLAKLFKDRVSS